MMRLTPPALLFSLLLVLGACGSDSAKVASAPPTTKAPSTTVAASDASSSATTAAAGSSGAVVEIKDSSLGKIVTNGSGVTLYMFTPDSATSSACTGGCASAWPPVTGPATKGTGVDADDLGVITRADGTKQATFYGHPLYTYAGDSVAGDVTGQGSGGKWFVLTSAGTAVKAAAGSTPTTVASSTTDDDSGY
jgi:predicted lipoprotein with Yx(FWY)xxD motif